VIYTIYLQVENSSYSFFNFIKRNLLIRQGDEEFKILIRALFVENDVVFLLPNYDKTMGVVSSAVNLFTCEFVNNKKSLKSLEQYDESVAQVILEAVKLDNKHLTNYQLRVAINRTVEQENPVASLLLSAAQRRLPSENPGMRYLH
jgi:hypothetical protein